MPSLHQAKPRKLHLKLSNRHFEKELEIYISNSTEGAKKFLTSTLQRSLGLNKNGRSKIYRLFGTLVEI